MDYQEVNDSPPTSDNGKRSLESHALTTKQYFLVNLSKCIVELTGTAVIGLFYLLIGDQQVGMLLGYWIVTLFGISISGAHFNPAITLVIMLRKNSSFGTRRLKGLLYMGAQFLGGIIAGMIALFIVESSNHDLAVKPVRVDEYTEIDTKKGFAAMVSELSGSFALIFLFMICTDKKTQFSSDKVINCFIIASSYCAARLMGGGRLVTAIQQIPFDNTLNSRISQTLTYKLVGPLLNPALAFGQCIVSGFDFTYWFQYILMPFASSALALIFYELVFVRSQEYMAEDTEDESDAGLILDTHSPKSDEKKERKASVEEEEEEKEEKA